MRGIAMCLVWRLVGEDELGKGLFRSVSWDIILCIAKEFPDLPQRTVLRRRRCGAVDNIISAHSVVRTTSIALDWCIVPHDVCRGDLSF